MEQPKDFSFSVESDPEVGSYIQFTYLGHSEYEDVWDDLCDIIHSSSVDLYRLEESSYECSGDCSDSVCDELRKLGFVEG